MQEQQSLPETGRLIDSFLSEVDKLHPDVIVLFRMFAFQAIEPAVLDELPETLDLGAPPPVLAINDRLRARMIDLAEREVSEFFLVQALAMVVTDVFRAEAEDEADENSSSTMLRRKKMWSFDVRARLKPFLSNESLTKLYFSL